MYVGDVKFMDCFVDKDFVDFLSRLVVVVLYLFILVRLVYWIDSGGR